VRRMSRLVGALLVVALLASACAREQAGPRLAADPDVPRGGVLTVGIGRPGGVDPGNAYEPNGTLIAATMCDPLIGVDPETGELVPGLAESWLIVEDGRRIIVKLRDGVAFPDGTPVRSADVVASLSRAASADFAGQAAELLSPIEGYAAIRGQDPEAPERDRTRLAGLTALTEQTVQISLVAPMADFVTVLTHPISTPLPATAMEADPDALESDPVCPGPYRLAEPFDAAQSQVRLVRNEEYGGWNDSYTGGGAGYADEIVFQVLPELGGVSQVPDAQEAADPAAPPRSAPQRPKLRALDVLAASGPLRDIADSQRGLEAVTVPGPGVEYLGLPVTADSAGDSADTAEQAATDGAAAPDLALDPLRVADEEPGTRADAPLRAALSMAINREALAQRLFDGRRAPATGFLPPTLGTNVARPDACGPTVPAAGDVPGARRVLQEAGVDLRGQELVVTYNDDYDNAALVRAVARQWTRAFEVNVTLQPMTWDDYLTKAESVEGFQGPFRFSWSSPFPSADRYLYPLFHTSGAGQTNFSKYSSVTFDDIITRQAREAPTVDDRTLVYRQLEDRLCLDLPLIPLLTEQRTWAVRPARIHSAAGDGAIAGGPRGEPLLRELGVASD